MILFASICIGLGIWPEYLYAMLPYEVTYVPYTVTHVVQMLQLLLFSGFAFFIMLPLMKRTLTITLDFDWTYRRFFLLVLRRLFAIVWIVDGVMRRVFLSKLDSGLSYLAKKNVGASSLLSRDHPAGSMVIWVAVLLAIYLLLSFIG
jgi:multicomponent Na+:H+ antiporter subunit D